MLAGRMLGVRGMSSAAGDSYKFLVLGGGAGGLAMSSYLARKFPNQVAVVEPSDTHYYQPLWTLVGAGLKDARDSKRPMASVIPSGAHWLQERAVEFHPEDNSVTTSLDKKIKYEVLIVALGLQLNFSKIPGLTEALGTKGVGCNYSINTVEDTFRELKQFRGGNAIFTLPATPVKCLGAPQKIMYLAEEIMTQNGVRDKANVMYKTPAGVIFAVEKYRNSLMEVCKQRNLSVDFFRNLVEINAPKREATFEHTNDEDTPKKTETITYDFIHVTPPMGPVEELQGSPLVDAAGFVEVDKGTLQHVRYENVFSLGDCSNLPVSKTAAAVAAESGVLRENVMSYVNHKPLSAKYTGYASCPLTTTSSTCILAEFDYSGQPRETFPVDQGQERSTMFFLKASVMPEIYWNGLIKGTWSGPEQFRKILHLGMV